MLEYFFLVGYALILLSSIFLLGFLRRCVMVGSGVMWRNVGVSETSATCIAPPQYSLHCQSRLQRQRTLQRQPGLHNWSATHVDSQPRLRKVPCIFLLGFFCACFFACIFCSIFFASSVAVFCSVFLLAFFARGVGRFACQSLRDSKVSTHNNNIYKGKSLSRSRVFPMREYRNNLIPSTNLFGFRRPLINH